MDPPDSVHSSPRSRTTDSSDDPLFGGAAKLRLMCSYGGRIVPRPHDKSLGYVGGDTRIVAADRRTSLADLTRRLSKTLLGGQPFALKYQLPNEDLDSLISVATDEDLENMVDEYDRLAAANKTAPKASRLRVFLFPAKPDSPVPDSSTNSDDWFLSGEFEKSTSVNCLLGLDDDDALIARGAESFDGVGGNSEKRGAQEVQSVSSFGSGSSSLANLPPIRVHVEDQKVAVGGGIEEQLSQMMVAEKQDEGGILVNSQAELMKSIGGVDFPSPDSVSSDISSRDQFFGQRGMINPDPFVQNPSNPNPRVQLQQVHDLAYIFQTQFDQQNHQFNPQQQQQQQQFVQVGGHYIHNHTVPIAPYYPIYPSQHQLDHVYYMPARQGQAYNIPAQQSNSRSQTPPLSSTAYNVSKNVQAPSSQHQLQHVGFSQFHHRPSQSIAPTSANTANYAYGFADAQMYYARPLGPQLASQYQTMTSGTENVKQQN